MKNLIEKLKTLTTSHHGELGLQSRQFEDLKAFIEENQWYTLTFWSPPEDELFLVELKSGEILGCRKEGFYFLTFKYENQFEEGHYYGKEHIAKWRKFPTS